MRWGWPTGCGAAAKSGYRPERDGRAPRLPRVRPGFMCDLPSNGAGKSRFNAGTPADAAVGPHGRPLERPLGVGGGSTGAGAHDALHCHGRGRRCVLREWLAAGRPDPELEQWAFGFASAIAAGAQFRSGDDPLANLHADAIHAWLADRCRGRPDEALSVALVRMVHAAVR